MQTIVKKRTTWSEKIHYLFGSQEQTWKLISLLRNFILLEVFSWQADNFLSSFIITNHITINLSY